MANDIIGGPEPIIFKGRMFKFSPLTDAEFSWLDSWVSFRLGFRAEALSEVGFVELQTFAGCTQLLHLSVSRNENVTLLDLGGLLFDDVDTCTEVFNFWYDLNFEIEWPNIPTSSSKPSDIKPSRKTNMDYLYAKLSTLYNWTPQQIANLTPYQQLVYAQQGIENTKPTLTFETFEAYQQWLQSKEQ